MPRHKRLRYRYSLRTLLVVTLMVAVYFAYAAYQDKERRLLISDIENAGGSVEFDDSLAFRVFHSERVTEVSIPHSSVGRINGARLKKFDNLATLELLDFESEMDDMRFQTSELRFTNITNEILDKLDAESAVD